VISRWKEKGIVLYLLDIVPNILNFPISFEFFGENI
jgi:hypothetical protein